MSYTRGHTYIWSDGEHLHIWSESGMDQWPEMEAYAGNPKASGVQLHEEIADEFAVMRVAELLKSKELSAVVERALKNWQGNTGCSALEQLSSNLIELTKAR